MVTEFGIGFSRIPNTLLGGKCKANCEKNEDEIQFSRNCDSGLKYCVHSNYSYWGDVKKFFVSDNENDIASIRKNSV